MDSEVDDGAWLNASRELLAAARADPGRLESSVRQLCAAAFGEFRFSPMIVWDYLVVSTPGLFAEAGFTEEEVDALMPMLERVVGNEWTSAARGRGGT